MSTLFTAVSVEQQETVAGGLAINFENVNDYTTANLLTYNQTANATQSTTSFSDNTFTRAIASFRVTGLNRTNLQ